MDDAPPDADEGDGTDGGPAPDDDRPTDAAGDDGDAATDASDGSPPFATELDRARDLLAAGDVTAFAAGVVRGGREVETTFSYRPDAVDADREGIQALTLLAAHLRVVADEAGVDPLTAATDAAALAERVEATETDGDADPSADARPDLDPDSDPDGRSDAGADADG